MSKQKPVQRLQIKKKSGRPKTVTREITKTSQEGLREGWTRATFIVKEDYLQQLKAVAYLDGMQIKDVLDEVLRAYLEKKVGAIPSGRR